MPPLRRGDLHDDMWAQNEPTFRRLYQTERHTLKQVKNIMEREHGFPITPLPIYESKLRDILGLRKKMKSEDWRSIYQHYVNSGTRHTALYLNGTRIQWNKAWKEIRRSHARDFVNDQPMALPAYVMMRSPSPVQIPHKLLSVYCMEMPWHLSDAIGAPVSSTVSLASATSAFVLQLQSIPSNLLRMNMLSAFQQFVKKPHIDIPESSRGGLALRVSSKSSITCNTPSKASVSYCGSNDAEINLDIDRLSNALYRLANGDVRSTYPGEPLDEPFEVILTLTPKNILIKLLESDSPVVQAAAEKLIRLSRRLGQEPGFLRFVNAVVFLHPEWTRNYDYLRFAANFGHVDLCQRLLLDAQTHMAPNDQWDYNWCLCEIIMTAIRKGHIECAEVIVRSITSTYATSFHVQDSIARNIFFGFILQIGHYYETEIIYEPEGYWTRLIPPVQHIFDLFFEVGAGVDMIVRFDVRFRTFLGNIPEYRRYSKYTRNTPYELMPTILEYLFLESFDLFSVLVSRSVQFKTKINRAGIYLSARDGIPSLFEYLQSRSSHTLVEQDALLDAFLVELCVWDRQWKHQDLQVIRTLLDYDPGIHELRAALDASFMLRRIVETSAQQGIHPEVPYILHILIQKGAIITAEAIAAGVGERSSDVFNLLSCCGADFKKDGALALATAAREGNYDAVNWLLEEGGVDINGVLSWKGGEVTIIAYVILASPQYFKLNYAMIENLLIRNALPRRALSDPDPLQFLLLLLTSVALANPEEDAVFKIKSLLSTGIIKDFIMEFKPPILKACVSRIKINEIGWATLEHLIIHFGLHIGEEGLLPALIYHHAPSHLIQMALDSGVDINAYSGGMDSDEGDYKSPELTPLQAAAVSHSFGLAKTLIRRGADVNSPAKGAMGRTALQAACEINSLTAKERSDKLAFVKFLITNGAEVNAPSTFSKGTAFQIAARTGDFAVALLLLNSGADINAPPAPHGQCALDAAASRGKIDMVYFLLGLGALSYDQGISGYRGAIRKATRNRYEAVTDIIRKYAIQNGKSGEELYVAVELWEESALEHSSGKDGPGEEGDTVTETPNVWEQCQIEF
ncbi:hypothetical protein GGS24DRAFT_485425 [Hypoxylon argillaceum]|nr:hypothetical protein GGS24DRAFT_485425 [Hypoxylon argillaceum]